MVALAPSSEPAQPASRDLVRRPQEYLLKRDQFDLEAPGADQFDRFLAYITLFRMRPRNPPAEKVRRRIGVLLRRILRRPEFNRDVLLRLNRPLVQQSGSVTPLSNGSHGGRKKRNRPAQKLYLQNLATLPDSDTNPYRFS